MIAFFLTDILLIWFMLLGLFDLRRRGGDTSELGRLLWKQVRWWRLQQLCF
jgi:hypothetical protein